jgi:hypothetical protein
MSMHSFNFIIFNRVYCNLRQNYSRYGERILQLVNKGREKNSGDDFSDETYNDLEEVMRHREEGKHQLAWNEVCKKTGRDPLKPCREMPMRLRKMCARKAWVDESAER